MRAIILAVLLSLKTLPLWADLFHVDTLRDIRAVSLAYDAQVCGVWVASEGPDLILLSTTGREIRRLASGMGMVRSLTVERDGLLLADGWGTFRRIDRDGAARDDPFQLSDTLYDTEGLHRDADGTFLVVEDDPSRLMRIAPDGAVLMELRGEGFTPRWSNPRAWP